MTDGLPGWLGWMRNPSDIRGIHYTTDGSNWDFASYRAIATAAGTFAERLRINGLSSPDLVLVEAQSTAVFAAAFFGIVAAGCTPAPMRVDGAGSTDDGADPKQLVDRFDPSAIVATTDQSSHAFESLAPPIFTIDGPVTDSGQVWDHRSPIPSTIDDSSPALLQLTSGSTGIRQAVEISSSALDSQVSLITEWLGISADTSMATWLPFYHDMGLVGVMLTGAAASADLHLMSPSAFVRRPSEWLATLARSEISVSAPFGISHVLRRVRPAQVDKLDLQHHRTMVLGAERINLPLVQEFSDFLHPAGFSPKAPTAGYGMAEATLAITGTATDGPIDHVRIHKRSHTIGTAVKLADDSTAPTGPENSSSIEVASIGKPLGGFDVKIVDETGALVPDLVVGEMVVGGPSMATVFRSSEERTPLPIPFPTGDIGFRHRGQLYILGRLGDSVKIRGQLILAEDIDSLLLGFLDRRRFIVTLGHESPEQPTCVVHLAAILPEQNTADLVGVIQRYESSLRVTIQPTERRHLLFTSSGKPRRRQMWSSYLNRRKTEEAALPRRPV